MNKNIRPIVRFTLVSILALNGACATEVDPRVDDNEASTETEAKDDDSTKQDDRSVPNVGVHTRTATYDLKAAKK